jgi:hypothetical protein
MTNSSDAHQTVTVTSTLIIPKQKLTPKHQEATTLKHTPIQEGFHDLQCLA